METWRTYQVETVNDLMAILAAIQLLVINTYVIQPCDDTNDGWLVKINYTSIELPDYDKPIFTGIPDAS